MASPERAVGSLRAPFLAGAGLRLLLSLDVTLWTSFGVLDLLAEVGPPRKLASQIVRWFFVGTAEDGGASSISHFWPQRFCAAIRVRPGQRGGSPSLPAARVLRAHPLARTVRRERGAPPRGERARFPVRAVELPLRSRQIRSRYRYVRTFSARLFLWWSSRYGQSFRFICALDSARSQRLAQSRSKVEQLANP